MNFTEASSGNPRDRTWVNNESGLNKIDMERAMEYFGGTIADPVFKNYYNNTIDVELAQWAGATGILIGEFANIANPIPEAVYANGVNRYKDLMISHIMELTGQSASISENALNTAVVPQSLAQNLREKYIFSVIDSSGTEQSLLKITENNPVVSKLLKQYDPAFNDLQYMKDYGCNFMASIAYTQMLTGVVFTAGQIKSIWNEAGTDSSVFNITSNESIGQGYVHDAAKLTDVAWKLLGNTNATYNNLALSFGDYNRYNTNTYLIANKLKLQYSTSGHFVSAGASDTILYNSANSVNTIKRRDEVKLYGK